MPSILSTVTGLLCLGSLVSAATEVKLLPGVCSRYPGAHQSATGNSFVGELNLKPLTGTYIDTLGTRFGKILETQPMVNPWYTVSAAPKTSNFTKFSAHSLT